MHEKLNVYAQGKRTSITLNRHVVSLIDTLEDYDDVQEIIDDSDAAHEELPEGTTLSALVTAMICECAKQQLEQKSTQHGPDQNE